MTMPMGGHGTNWLKEHAALGALTWPVLPDLRVHRAGVFGVCRPGGRFYALTIVVAQVLAMLMAGTGWMVMKMVLILCTFLSMG